MYKYSQPEPTGTTGLYRSYVNIMTMRNTATETTGVCFSRDREHIPAVILDRTQNTKHSSTQGTHGNVS